METENRVKLIPQVGYRIADEELERMYEVMALVKYNYERSAEYPKVAIIRRLRNQFKNYNKEIIRLSNAEPNSLVLNEMKLFFCHHYGHLKDVLSRLEEEKKRE